MSTDAADDPDGNARPDGNLQFLKFLVAVTEPATGQYLLPALAGWLDMPPAALTHRWLRSGQGTWQAFAADVISVLDPIQDETHSLAMTFSLYRTRQLPGANHCTPDELVAMGHAAQAIAAQRRMTAVRN